MDLEEYRNTIRDIVYLCACAVDGETPSAPRVAEMDPGRLYAVAERFLLTGIVALALESAGVKNERFTQALGKAIRKVAAFDMERGIVLDAMEKAGIWYMPLKGAVLKDLYPMIGMRQMADNDILFDASRADELRSVMEGLGFETDYKYGRFAHDSYFKPPVYNFEMHRMLFGANVPDLSAYYENVKDRLLKVQGKQYAYRFSEDDFYVYLISHEYKHYSGGGTGLRSLLDTYVYCTKMDGILNWDYIKGEIEKLRITEFESTNRSLALHLFSGGGLRWEDFSNKLGTEERDMLDFILSSGTYGSTENRVKNSIAKKGGGFLGKVRYVIGRIFLPMETIRYAFPVFAKYPVLLPFLPFYRFFHGLMIGGKKRFLRELRAFAGYKDKE